MDPPILPPEKRASFPSPAMLIGIAGIIVGALVMFLVLRPN
jgi:hypothetical protein